MDKLTLTQALLYFSPFILAQLILDIYCIFKLFKDGVRNLNKPAWLLIILCINLFGAIAFLAFGKRRWDDDQD